MINHCTNHVFKRCKGVTLIEIILYISIASVITITFGTFISTIFQAKNRALVVSEVDQQALQTLQLITQSIHNADTIQGPITGQSGTTLTLKMTDPLKDPTIFNLSNGNLTIKEGTGSEVLLNSNRTKFDSLNFQNLSRPNTPGIIKTDFLISYKNNQSQADFRYQKAFFTSSALK